MPFLVVTPDCRVLCSQDIAESNPELYQVLESREKPEETRESTINYEEE